MKKLFGIILSVLLCGILFTSFSPSLDGRAVVADEGVMPKGVFAKTVGYLPGDSISVTSLITKKSVDILVIGSIDSSEGIAILLSPEAAELLGLSKDLNNVVKITKRSGQLDEAVAGTAVIGGVVEGSATEYDENSSVDVEPEETYEEEKQTPVEEIESTEENTENQEAENETENAEENSENSESVEEISEVPEEKAVEKEPEVIEATENEVAKEPEIETESVQEIEETPIESESVQDEPLEEIVATEVPEVSEEKAEEQPIEEEISELEEEPVESDKVQDEPEVIEATELPEEVVEAEKTTESEPVESEEIPESDEFAGERVEDEDLSELPTEKAEEISEEVPTEESVEDKVEDNKEKIEENAEEVPVEEEIPDEKAEEDVPSAIPFEEESISADELSELPSEPEKNVVSNAEPETSNEVSSNEGDESFEPIVLVPTESNPPEATKSEKTDEAPKPNENIVPKTVLTENLNKKSLLEKYKVNSLKELESGKYYVQIAVLADETNIKDIISKYAEQYPVVLVPLASGKATQVMIGPLNMDEYGTVLNRFKKSGYKDAFLRKIR